jgi:Na+-translocating ferredoxin:NAD+ oxidoreductase RnfG subunit
MASTLRWISGAALATPALVQAAQYATLDEAARRSFPEATSFRELLVPPAAGEPHAWRMLVALKGEQPLGVVVADAVIGKFELIDYAVGIAQDGKIRNVEILSYRESHGYEIKLPAWRAQFVGKGADAKLRVGEDIANISGATLSCTHVTDGVRRIVALVERLRASGRL